MTAHQHDDHIVRIEGVGLLEAASAARRLYDEAVALRREQLWSVEGLDEAGQRAYLAGSDLSAVHFVAVRGERVLGTVQLDAARARLRQLVVDPRARRRGVAARLLAALEAEARGHGGWALQVNAWLDSAGFYAGRGYHAHGAAYRDDRGRACQVMLKLLRLPPGFYAGANVGCAYRSRLGAGKLRLLLVRHGESANNALSLATKQHIADADAAARTIAASRSHDPPLSDLGQRQARACAAALWPQLHGATTVWISPFLRTLQTAAAIAAAAAVPSRASPLHWCLHRQLFEYGGCYAAEQGRLPGMTPEQIARQFPAFADRLPADWPADQGWFAASSSLPGKETYEQFVARVADLIEQIWSFAAARSADAATLVLVGHGDLFDLLLGLLTAGAVDSRGQCSRFVHDNTGVSCLALDPHARSCYLVEINNAMHLYSDTDVLFPQQPSRLVGWEIAERARDMAVRR